MPTSRGRPDPGGAGVDRILIAIAERLEYEAVMAGRDDDRSRGGNHGKVRPVADRVADPCWIYLGSPSNRRCSGVMRTVCDRQVRRRPLI
jgi:hypothetical protein